ncbi:TetR/AcrR family transcriptional regulator [Nonomuraea sp. NPDC050783]|uniref:TetR/AcrR family transcriptional regulator n=1 Tax=Nonomuraea sp. NPDC050783 TaxID=3154634 RepID=UPI0034674851
MARTRSSEQRRGDLLDAAERLVLAKGVEPLRIDDVVAGAGVAKGTFYLHFASKDDLIAALRDRYVERFVTRQRQAADAETGPARVEAWLLAGIAEYLSDARLHDVLFRHAPAAQAEPGPNPAVTALRQLLEKETSLPDPGATAVLLYHAMHGGADHILHAPEDRRRLLDEVTRLCRALVRA